MTILLITLALLLLIAVVLFARVTTRRVETLGSVAELAVNVDVAALNRLLDADDDRFLRSRLPGSTYKRIRRRRDRLVLSYVGVMLHNTGVLMAFAASVRQHLNPEVDVVAAQVIYTAMRVRLRLAAVTVTTALDWLLPVLPPSSKLIEPYAELQERAALLFRTLDPARSSQAVAAL